MYVLSLNNISFKAFKISAGLVQTHLFADELLPQELTGLKHVRDVVEWTETFVFVFVLLLNRKDRGQGRREGQRGEKVIHDTVSKMCNFTHPPQMRTFEGGTEPPTLPTQTPICTQWLCLFPLLTTAAL